MMRIGLLMCLLVFGIEVSAQVPEDSIFNKYRIEYPSKLPYKATNKEASIVTTIPDPVMDQTVAFRALLDSTYKFNKQLKYADGFRIVVYTGADREQVNKSKERIYRLLGADANVYVAYKQPTFQIKVGDYLDRMQAQFAYKKLREGFSNPLIIQERVNLVRPDEPKLNGDQ
jgi:hypothetical protein